MDQPVQKGVRNGVVRKWKNLFRSGTFSLWTPLTPDEIQSEMRPFMYQQARRGDPGPIFKGDFEPDGFRIRWSRIDKRTGWPTWFVAHYTPAREGTRLTMKHASTRSPSTVILLAAILAACTAFLSLGMGKFLYTGVYALTAVAHLAAYATYRRSRRRAIEYYRRFLTFVLMARDPEAAALSQLSTDEIS